MEKSTENENGKKKEEEKGFYNPRSILSDRFFGGSGGTTHKGGVSVTREPMRKKNGRAWRN